MSCSEFAGFVEESSGQSRPARPTSGLVLQMCEVSFDGELSMRWLIKTLEGCTLRHIPPFAAHCSDQIFMNISKTYKITVVGLP